MADTIQLPAPVISGSDNWLGDMTQLVISRAVDAEFIRKTGLTADPNSWPGFNENGQAFARGESATGAAASIGMPLLIGGGVIALALIVWLMKD